jgi:hypothetical protein
VRVGHTLTADFDDPNLASTGGLVPVMALAEQTGLHDLAAEHVHISLLDLTEHMGLIETYLLAGAGRTPCLIWGSCAGSPMVGPLWGLGWLEV